MKPNFFIVGGPKCGTTALSVYLKEHPEIFFTEPKEPEFFGADLPKHDSYKWRVDKDAYMSLFDDAQDCHVAVGEGSVMYMFSKQAVSAIHRFNPAARLIVMVRNPVELIYSFHNHLCYLFIEDEVDFEKAWSLQSERQKGNRIPKDSLKPQYLQYSDIAMQGQQLKRVLDIFPREQVFIGFHEDLKKDPRDLYCRVLDFLGAEDDGRVEFQRENYKLHHRFPLISRVKNKLPRPLKKTIELGSKLMRKLPLVRNFSRFNTVRKDRPELSSEFRAQLIGHYVSDIELTEQITGRNLSAWKQQ